MDSAEQATVADGDSNTGEEFPLKDQNADTPMDVSATSGEHNSTIRDAEPTELNLLNEQELEGMEEDTAGLDEWQLPLSIIQRVVKERLPEGTTISKDAKSAMARIATVFINYLSINAFDASVSKNRKTLSGSSIEQALIATRLDFLLPAWRMRMEAWNVEMAERRSKHN